MAYCEDFPCCGHEDGCCPDFDANGRQLNKVCTCGKKLPLTSPSSICRMCVLRLEYEGGGYMDDDDYFADRREADPADYQGDEDEEEEFCEDDDCDEDNCDDDSD